MCCCCRCWGKTGPTQVASAGCVLPHAADSLTTPIVQTATYSFRDKKELISYQEGRHGSFEYGRPWQPNNAGL